MNEKIGKDVDLQERVRLKTADRDELYSLEPPFPKSNFLMELSNACNHACIFCAHQKMRRKVGKIDKNLAFDILQQAYDLGTREVGFYATGEPFLVPDLPEYIKKAKDIGYTYVYLTSNGSLATPEKIRAVMRFSGPRMMFRHPVMAVRHVLEVKKEKRRLEMCDEV